MRRLILRSLSTIVLTVSVLFVVPADAIAQADLQAQRPVIRRPIPREAALAGFFDFARTELYFGTAKPDGVVTDEQFRAFVDAQITPRFPDGLTLLKGDGQFKSEDGTIIKEESFVLILLYPVEVSKDANRKINTIRRLYRRQFDQESVLRVDDPLAVRVSF